MITLIGYHGTTRKNAENILKTKHFIESTKNREWLGRGIYFFTDIKYARWWANEQVKNKGGMPAVLKVILKCEDEFFWDLFESDNFDKFNQEFFDEVKTWGKEIEMSSHQRQCVACDFFCEKHKIKIIAFKFLMSINKKYKNTSGFSLAELQQQLCVKDHDCIFNIESVL